MGVPCPWDAGTAHGSHACLEEWLCPVHPGSPSTTKGAVVSLKRKKWSFQVPVFSTCSSPGNGHNLTFLNYYGLGIRLCWKGGKAQWKKSPGSCKLWLMKCGFTWPPIADAHFMLDFFHAMSPLLAGAIVLITCSIFSLGLCTLLRHKGTNPQSVQMKWI